MAKDPLRTKFCDMMGIEFPIIAFTLCKDVVAAVVNAGGFAVLGEAMHTPDHIEDDIKWIRSRVSDKPFGILSSFKKEFGTWYLVDGKVLPPKQVVRAEPKTGRNDPCPCGSSRKFKKCCGSQS